MASYLSDLMVIENDEEPRKGWKKIDVDLNKRAGGGGRRRLYFAYEPTSDRTNALTDVKILSHPDNQSAEQWEEEAGPSYRIVWTDLNKGVEGNFIYAAYSKETTKGAITDLDVISCGKPVLGVSGEWEVIEKDLNERAGGDYIYLMFTRSSL